MYFEDFLLFMIAAVVVVGISLGVASAIDADHNSNRRIGNACVKNGNTWIEHTCIPGKAK
jgi:hypothetical protein